MGRGAEHTGAKRKRRRIRRYAAALFAALLLCALLGSASASTGTVMKPLEYKNIRVSLDGAILDLRDAAGRPVEPFMFEGTNYLPVRAMAEALGLQVRWDSANATIVLSTPGKRSPRQEMAGDIGEHHIEIRGAVLSADPFGEQIVKVTYAWTNNSEETDIAYGTISTVAFQDGIEMDECDISDLFSGMAPEIRWVRPGATIDLVSAYYLMDESAPVQFEVYETGKFSDDGEAVFGEFDPTAMEREALGKPSTPGYIAWRS